jgi:hypothetical protein
VTSGDGISACWMCQLPPLNEALGAQPLRALPASEMWLPASDPAGDACRRLKKTALSYTGEVPRRPAVR